MILLAYILQGHPEWDEASISVFFLHDGDNAKEEEEALRVSILEGRLPIAEQNIEHTTHEGSSVQTIKNKSGGADLVILGFTQTTLKPWAKTRLSASTAWAKCCLSTASNPSSCNEHPHPFVEWPQSEFVGPTRAAMYGAQTRKPSNVLWPSTQHRSASRFSMSKAT